MHIYSVAPEGSYNKENRGDKVTVLEPDFCAKGMCYNDINYLKRRLLIMGKNDYNEPIGMWGYFGYEILFGLPVIGWIVLIIMAIGARNVNVKNFARSKFCVLIIWLIICAIIAICGGFTALFESLYQ